MLAGDPYRGDDPELVAERRRCEAQLRAFNQEPDENERARLLRDLVGQLGEGATAQPPLTCDYGYNVALGTGTFVNSGAIILDVTRVAIGDHVQIGTGVQILTADHP